MHVNFLSAVAGAVAGAVLVAGCGGSSSHHSQATPRAETMPTPVSSPTPPPTTGSGIRSVTEISTCLAQHQIPTVPPRVPPGMPPAASPQIVLAMPWGALQITVYDKPQADASAVTLSNAGAVMTRGNVSVALDNIPLPPADVVRTIQTCALG